MPSHRENQPPEKNRPFSKGQSPESDQSHQQDQRPPRLPSHRFDLVRHGAQPDGDQTSNNGSSAADQPRMFDLVRQGAEDQSSGAGRSPDRSAHSQGREISSLHPVEERFKEEVDRFNQNFEQAIQTADQKLVDAIGEHKQYIEETLVQYQDDFDVLMEIHIEEFNDEVSVVESEFKQALDHIHPTDTPLERAIQIIQQARDHATSTISEKAEETIQSMDWTVDNTAEEAKKDVYKQSNDAQNGFLTICVIVEDFWENIRSNIIKNAEYANNNLEDKKGTEASKIRTLAKSVRLSGNKRAAINRIANMQSNREYISSLQKKIQKLKEETINSERLTKAIQDIKEKIRESSGEANKKSAEFKNQIEGKIGIEQQKTEESSQQAIERINEQAASKIQAIKEVQQRATNPTEEQDHAQEQKISPLHQAEERFKEEVNHFNQTFEQAKQTVDKELKRAIEEIQEETTGTLDQYKEDFNRLLEIRINSHKRKISEIERDFNKNLEQINSDDAPVKSTIITIKSILAQAEEDFKDEAYNVSENLKVIFKSQVGKFRGKVKKEVIYARQKSGSIPEKLKHTWETGRSNIGQYAGEVNDAAKRIMSSMESEKQSMQGSSDNNRHATLKSLSSKSMKANITEIQQRTQELREETIKGERLERALQEMEQANNRRTKEFDESTTRTSNQITDGFEKETANRIQAIQADLQAAIQRIKEQATSKIRAIRASQQQTW